MNLMIASDLHGSAFYCRQMLDAFDREQPDRLLLLGDLLYHGPRNDLPEGYDPKAVLAMLNERRDQLLCVRGNCDAEVDQMVLQFPMMADYCMIYLGRRMVYATHGHHRDLLPSLRPGDILLHGHTHVPACEPLENGAFYINPGSVSIPKENSPHSYLMLTDDMVQWKDLSGAVCHTLIL